MLEPTFVSTSTLHLFAPHVLVSRRFEHYLSLYVAFLLRATLSRALNGGVKPSVPHATSPWRFLGDRVRCMEKTGTNHSMR
jgi:hypothetical protein